MYAIIAAVIFVLLLVVVSFIIRRRSRIRKAERAIANSIVTTIPMFKPEVVVLPRDVIPAPRTAYPVDNLLPLVSHPKSLPLQRFQRADELSRL